MLIEKEIILQSEDNTKATIFFIRARSVKDFFNTAEEIRSKLNAATNNKYNLKVNYDLMFSNISFPIEINKQNNKELGNHSAIG